MPERTTEPVHVALRLLGFDGPATIERLPAEPVGPDTYRLAASSLHVALARGDLVRCAGDADGRLVVVDVVEPCDAILSVFAPAPGTDEDGVRRLAGLWEATGAGPTEIGGGFVVTVWPGVPMDAVAAQLNSDQAAGRGEWILAAEPAERGREAQADVDFGPA